EGTSTKPPAALYADMPFPRLAAFPTGDVLIAARKGDMGQADRPLVARHWAPGKKVTEHSLAKVFPGDDYPDFTEIAPDEVYAVAGARLARWDGTTFRLLARMNKTEPVKRVRRAAPDDLWILTTTSTLQHVTGGSATSVATPEPIADFDGVGEGMWIVGA